MNNKPVHSKIYWKQEIEADKSSYHVPSVRKAGYIRLGKTVAVNDTQASMLTEVDSLINASVEGRVGAPTKEVGKGSAYIASPPYPHDSKISANQKNNITKISLIGKEDLNRVFNYRVSVGLPIVKGESCLLEGWLGRIHRVEGGKIWWWWKRGAWEGQRVANGLRPDFRWAGRIKFEGFEGGAELEGIAPEGVVVCELGKKGWEGAVIGLPARLRLLKAARKPARAVLERWGAENIIEGEDVWDVLVWTLRMCERASFGRFHLRNAVRAVQSAAPVGWEDLRWVAEEWSYSVKLKKRDSDYSSAKPKKENYRLLALKPPSRESNCSRLNAIINLSDLRKRYRIKRQSAKVWMMNDEEFRACLVEREGKQLWFKLKAVEDYLATSIKKKGWGRIPKGGSE